MKAIIALGSLFIAVVLTGCLGSSSSSTAPTLAFAYVVGQGSNSIRAFTEKSTGDLQALAVPSFATNPVPVSIALHPSKNFLYVANLTANTVAGFTVDHVAGILTPVGTAVPPTPACVAPATCSNPIGVAIDSGGHFLFLLNQGSASPAVAASISVFSIDTTRGLLTPIAGSPFSFASLVAPNPQFLATSPTAGFLYVSNGASGNISSFSIAGNGTLTELTPAIQVGTGVNVAGLAIDAKGQFLYAADPADNAIASFSIAGNGVLTSVGPPFPSDFGPAAVAVDSTSSFLYSANKPANSVSAFKISSGVLTQIAGSPFALTTTGTVGPPQPTFLTVDATNTFLLVANQGTSNISVFGIKATDGTLGLITDSPFGVGVQPLWIVSTQ